MALVGILWRYRSNLLNWITIVQMVSLDTIKTCEKKVRLTRESRSQMPLSWNVLHAITQHSIFLLLYFLIRTVISPYLSDTKFISEEKLRHFSTRKLFLGSGKHNIEDSRNSKKSHINPFDVAHRQQWIQLTHIIVLINRIGKQIASVYMQRKRTKLN